MPNKQLATPTLPFSYEIIRSKRKTLVLYIRGGKVEVRSPLRASSTWIQSFLNKNTPWILEQLKHQRLKNRERLVIANNRMVPFLGKPRRLQVIISNKQKVLIKGDNLFIFVRSRNQDKVEKLFHDWLREQAHEYMGTQTIKYARELGLEHKLKDVTFRMTKSKWGHCCQDGSIQYNWLAMMAPRKVINYLIAHETSHLKQMNHSSRFWDTVALLCPQYKALRLWLAENGHRFWTGTS